MDKVTTRAGLESRLRAVAAALVLRQAARCAVSAVAGSAAGLGLAVMMFELLPRLVLGSGAGNLSLVLAAVAGAALAVVLEMRRYRAPSLQDAALALEARLASTSDAIAAALVVRDEDPFCAPVMQRAGRELAEAQKAPSPVLIRTRKLVLVPLLVLASGISCAAVISANVVPVGEAGKHDGSQRSTANWSGFDAGGSRSEGDRNALRQALGMKEAAATLNQSAETLRDASAGKQSHDQALRDARAALDAGPKEGSDLKPDDMPAVAPATQTERDALAARLEGAAKGMANAAAEIEKGVAGTSDTGMTGDFNTKARIGELVAFPVLKRGDVTAVAVTGQTAARRDLAIRAVKELEGLQK